MKVDWIALSLGFLLGLFYSFICFFPWVEEYRFNKKLKAIDRMIAELKRKE
jgi:hypothetical protein